MPDERDYYEQSLLDTIAKTESERDKLQLLACALVACMQLEGWDLCGFNRAMEIARAKGPPPDSFVADVRRVAGISD